MIQPDMFGAEDRRVMDRTRRRKAGRLPQGTTKLRVGGVDYPLTDGKVDAGAVLWPLADWLRIQAVNNRTVLALVMDLAGEHYEEV